MFISDLYQHAAINALHCLADLLFLAGCVLSSIKEECTIKQSIKLKRYVLILIAILLVLFCFTMYKIVSASSGKLNPDAVILHFYYDGDRYYNSGQGFDYLPEGYYYAGEVIDAGNAQATADFEGNASGSVYFNDDKPNTAYWQSDANLPMDSGEYPYVYCTVR